VEVGVQNEGGCEGDLTVKVSLTDSDKDLDVSSAYLSSIKLACMENGDPPSSLAGSTSDLTSESPTVAPAGSATGSISVSPTVVPAGSSTKSPIDSTSGSRTYLLSAVFLASAFFM